MAQITAKNDAHSQTHFFIRNKMRKGWQKLHFSQGVDLK